MSTFVAIYELLNATIDDRKENALRDYLKAQAAREVTDILADLKVRGWIDDGMASRLVIEMTGSLMGQEAVQPVDIRIEEKEAAAPSQIEAPREAEAPEPRSEGKGGNRCPICGKPISRSATACRKHYRQVRRMRAEGHTEAFIEAYENGADPDTVVWKRRQD